MVQHSRSRPSLAFSSLLLACLLLMGGLFCPGAAFTTSPTPRPACIVCSPAATPARPSAPLGQAWVRGRSSSSRVLSRLLATAGGYVGSKVVEVKSLAETEEQLKAAGDKLVVLDFTATWCGPCKLVAPVFEALSGEYEGKAVFLKVDVDVNEETAQHFEVFQMPTFVFVKGGDVVGKLIGGNPDKLREALLKFL